jgi:methylated-DNA-[protein]-cysteine S-methyltransferase
MELWIDEMDSPLGGLLVATADGTLCALDYAGYEERLRKLGAARFGAIALRPAASPAALRAALRDYFAGDLRATDRVRVRGGGTPFQEKVWALLRSIPPGTTTTYGALAARLGTASASRAVGLANARNPIAIVVPCHRVIGASGALTGYAGGLERKRWLLRHEGAEAARPPAPRAAREGEILAHHG